VVAVGERVRAGRGGQRTGRQGGLGLGPRTVVRVYGAGAGHVGHRRGALYGL